MSSENKLKIALVDDYEEIRDLVTFMVEANMDATVISFSSGNQAIAKFKEDFDYDVVITDMNMPDGNGADVYMYLRSSGNEVPVIFLTTEIPEKQAQLKTVKLKAYGHITKPFTDEDLVSSIKKSLNMEDRKDTYVPVNIKLLRKLQVIHAPLFIKINDQKYVKVANENSTFGETEYLKYYQKGVLQLYTESEYIDQLIKEFRKESLSEDAFNNASLSEAAENVSINVDMMKSVADKLGYTKEVVQMAEENLSRALALAKNHPELRAVFQQFLKIERYGYADHCTLMILLTTGLARQIGIVNPKVVRQLTFAALFHDACLKETQYHDKKKYLKMIERKENLHSKDVKEVMTHTARAAELVRNWDFCPSGSAEIIFTHHENPQGTGFPMGLKASEIDELSALFIIAEDLVLNIIDFSGAPDLKAFLQAREPYYKAEPYNKIFSTLKQSIETAQAKS